MSSKQLYTIRIALTVALGGFLTGFINSGISFLVQLIFPWELATLGSSTTFLIYGLFAAAGFIFVWMVVPETKGKTLEELEKQLVK